MSEKLLEAEATAVALATSLAKEGPTLDHARAWNLVEFLRQLVAAEPARLAAEKRAAKKLADAEPKP
jgi:hypothetical protein